MTELPTSFTSEELLFAFVRDGELCRTGPIQSIDVDYLSPSTTIPSVFDPDDAHYLNFGTCAIDVGPSRAGSKNPHIPHPIVMSIENGDEAAVIIGAGLLSGHSAIKDGTDVVFEVIGVTFKGSAQESCAVLAEPSLRAVTTTEFLRWQSALARERLG